MSYPVRHLMWDPKARQLIGSSKGPSFRAALTWIAPRFRAFQKYHPSHNPFIRIRKKRRIVILWIGVGSNVYSAVIQGNSSSHKRTSPKDITGIAQTDKPHAHLAAGSVWWDMGETGLRSHSTAALWNCAAGARNGSEECPRRSNMGLIYFRKLTTALSKSGSRTTNCLDHRSISNLRCILQFVMRCCAR